MVQRHPRVCAYCGCDDPETVDHVPPKGIFPPPLPSDLLTVPCCYRCHSDTSEDDEHFRNVLLISADLEHDPRASRSRERILRSRARPEQNTYWQEFVDSVEDVDVFSGGGIWIGRQPGIPISSPVRRVVERMARGLYFHEYGTPFPHTHEVVRATTDQFGVHITHLATTFGVSFDRRSACDDQFAYGFKMVDGDNASGIWIGEFFGRSLVVAFFAEKGWHTRRPDRTPQPHLL